MGLDTLVAVSSSLMELDKPKPFSRELQADPLNKKWIMIVYLGFETLSQELGI